MFTDIVKSTDLIGVIGDEAWSDLVRWHDETIRSVFGEHRGEEINHAGDGFFAAFDDAEVALRCAIAIQRRLADHRRTHGFAPQVRIGLHTAQSTSEGGMYRGKGVHEAARIGALAGGGEIVASCETLEDIETAFRCSEERAVSLKGITEPVRVVSVAWQ